MPRCISVRWRWIVRGQGCGDGGRADDEAHAEARADKAEVSRALREICGALKPGGYLVVAEVIGDPHYQFKKKVAKMGMRAGLRPGEVAGGFFAYTMRLYRPEGG